MRLIRNSLHDEVADGLRARIFDGLLAPGSFIDEWRFVWTWRFHARPCARR